MCEAFGVVYRLSFYLVDPPDPVLRPLSPSPTRPQCRCRRWCVCVCVRVCACVCVCVCVDCVADSCFFFTGRETFLDLCRTVLNIFCCVVSVSS